jgi:hypothetical protein
MHGIKNKYIAPAVFCYKTYRKYTSARHRRRWEDIIKMDLEERGWEGVDWIHLDVDRDHCWGLVGAVGDVRVLQIPGKILHKLKH